ncbi:MAG: hypothetical protein WAW39_03140 [Prosthecobacter sp.]|jgi:hypothetical protein|uniref:hypothetical protein n=1 Tax=Prosthecobacter sp. TaxID=1965333 RepID=UPI003BB1344A
MIQTSIGTLQVGSPWLARQWVNTIPGVTVTTGITQNNLTIRAGNKRPSFTTAQSSLTPPSVFVSGTAPGTVTIPLPDTGSEDFGFFIGGEFTYINRNTQA